MSEDNIRAWQHVPGPKGWPILGSTLDFVRDPFSFAQALYKNYGEVSRFSVLGKPYVMLIGPEANDFVVRDRDQLFSSAEAYQPFMGDMFPGALGLMDFEEHARHRRILQSAFNKESMQRYIAKLHVVTQAYIESLNASDSVQFYPVLKDLLLKQAAELFFGESVADDIALLGKHFHNMGVASTSIIRLPIPLTPYWRGMKGKQYIWRYMAAHIQEKRETLTDDLFSHVCHAESEDGEKLTDQEVLGHMVGLLAAAHETNASAFSCMAFALAKKQDLQQQVAAELLSADDPGSFDDIRGMKLTGMVFQETLRLWGPSHSLPRMALKSFEFNGFNIPAGTMVLTSPSSTHRLEAFWQQPNEFDCTRFSTDKKEHSQKKFQYMPFGGGAHACLGMQLADVQMKILYWHVCKRFELALADPLADLDLAYLPTPVPKDGLKLKLTLK